MDTLELFRQDLQFGIANAQRLQFLYRRQYVVSARARAAVALAGIMQLLGEAQLAGILAMTAVNHIAKRVYAFLRVIVEPNPAPRLPINPRNLFARAQIFDRFGSPCRCHAVGNAAAIAAAVQAEHEAGLFGGSAVHKRIHAESAVGADEPRIAALQKIEAWPPHQRAVTEDP